LDRRTTAAYGGTNTLVTGDLCRSVTTMPEAFWEMERRRVLGVRTSEIAGYAALEYPRESTAYVLRMVDVSPARQARWFRKSVLPTEAGSSHVGSPSE